MQQEQPLRLSMFLKLLLGRLLTLVLATVLGAGIGYGLSYLNTPKWRAVAQFEQPTVLELGNYYALYSTYLFLNGGESAAYQVVKDEKGTSATEYSHKAEDLAVEESYNEFKRQLTSPDVLVDFLSQTEIVKQKARLENKPIASIAQQTASQFVFQSSTKSQPADRLSVISVNPEEANQLLAEFITFANQQTKQVLNAGLIAKWKMLFQQIKTAAEIKLGAIQQGNQIAAQDWQGKLNLMRAVQPLDDKLTAFRFIKAPSVPFTPDSPNAALWLMIGALSGLLFGIVLVSMPRLLRRKPRNGEQN